MARGYRYGGAGGSSKSYDLSSLAGYQDIIDDHKGHELLSNRIGEAEVNITFNGEPWTFQLGDIDVNCPNELIFVSKYLWKSSKWYGATSPYNIKYADSILYSELANFYSLISAYDKSYIKDYNHSQYSGSWNDFTAKIFAAGRKEVLDDMPSGTPTYTQIRFAIFATANGRIRTLKNNATPMTWWTRDLQNQSGNVVVCVGTNGEKKADASTVYNQSQYILPCFRMIANK